MLNTGDFWTKVANYATNLALSGGLEQKDLLTSHTHLSVPCFSDVSHASNSGYVHNWAMTHCHKKNSNSYCTGYKGAGQQATTWEWGCDKTPGKSEGSELEGPSTSPQQGIIFITGVCSLSVLGIEHLWNCGFLSPTRRRESEADIITYCPIPSYPEFHHSGPSRGSWWVACSPCRCQGPNSAPHSKHERYLSAK